MTEKKETKITHSVNHRFVCEHCNELNGWTTTVFEGKTKEEILNNKIPEAQKNIERGDYGSIDCLLKCEKCGKRQSWQLKDAQKTMLYAPFAGILAVTSISWLLIFFHRRSWILPLFVGIFVVATIAFFIFGLVGYIRVKSHMNQTRQRNIPEIDWGI